MHHSPPVYSWSYDVLWSHVPCVCSSRCQQLPADGPQKHDVQAAAAARQTLRDRAAQHLGPERPPGLPVCCLRPRPPDITWPHLLRTQWHHTRCLHGHYSDLICLFPNIRSSGFPFGHVTNEQLMFPKLILAPEHSMTVMSGRYDVVWSRRYSWWILGKLRLFTPANISWSVLTSVPAAFRSPIARQLILAETPVCLYIIFTLVCFCSNRLVWTLPHRKQKGKKRNRPPCKELSFILIYILLPECNTWSCLFSWNEFVFCTTEERCCKEKLWNRFVHFAL